MGLFWARLRAKSRLEQLKAWAYDAFRDARFRFRLCPECKRPFVPVRRQSCSQAVRTRKWRMTHPEKNREIRRQHYQRSEATRLGLSKKRGGQGWETHRGSPKRVITANRKILPLVPLRLQANLRFGAIWPTRKRSGANESSGCYYGAFRCMRLSLPCGGRRFSG
jgi:hypothetical protein